MVFKIDLNTDAILVTGEKKIVKTYEEIQNDEEDFSQDN